MWGRPPNRLEASRLARLATSRGDQDRPATVQGKILIVLCCRNWPVSTAPCFPALQVGLSCHRRNFSPRFVEAFQEEQAGFLNSRLFWLYAENICVSAAFLRGGQVGVAPQSQRPAARTARLAVEYVCFTPREYGTARDGLLGGVPRTRSTILHVGSRAYERPQCDAAVVLV